MRGPMLLSFGLLAALAACDSPPASSRFNAKSDAASVPIGDNKTGEPCKMANLKGGGADITCGEWTQPSARIRPGGPAGPGDLATLATKSSWRNEIESRFACGEPQPDSSNTVILQCSRRAGGWAQVALVTVIDGRAWLADGTPAAYPVIQRGIAQLAGSPVAASTAPSSAATASYLAAGSFSAGDIAAYERKMSEGLEANLAAQPEKAEKAYRAALDLQEKAQGRDSPAAAAPMMSLALQLSVQGRFDDAEQYLNRAKVLVEKPGADKLDRNGRARIVLYQGLHTLNQGKAAAAVELFKQAEAAYRTLVPEAPNEALSAGRRPSIAGASVSTVTVGDALARTVPYATLAEKEALLGILEARRDRAVALRLLGQARESAEAGRSAER